MNEERGREKELKSAWEEKCQQLKWKKRMNGELYGGFIREKTDEVNRQK